MTHEKGGAIGNNFKQVLVGDADGAPENCMHEYKK